MFSTRPWTRLAVSVLVVQMGLRIFKTSSVTMMSTRFEPITGRA